MRRHSLHGNSFNDLYSNDAIAAQLDSRYWGGQLDVGAAFGSWGEWRLGVSRTSFDGRLNVSDSAVPNPGRSELGGLTTRFIYDTQDLRLFPTAGSYGSISGYYSTTSLGALAELQHRLDQLADAFTSSRRNVWTAIVRAGSDFGSHVPYYDQFSEGGLFNFSGYQINQLIGREYVFGAMQYRRAISYLTESLGTAVYLGATLEAGNVYQRLDGAPSTGALVGGVAVSRRPFQARPRVLRVRPVRGRAACAVPVPGLGGPTFRTVQMSNGVMAAASRAAVRRES